GGRVTASRESPDARSGRVVVVPRVLRAEHLPELPGPRGARDGKHVRQIGIPLPNESSRPRKGARAMTSTVFHAGPIAFDIAWDDAVRPDDLAGKALSVYQQHAPEVLERVRIEISAPVERLSEPCATVSELSGNWRVWRDGEDHLVQVFGGLIGEYA